jgi:glycosyltransferase involved in cell wall biosynthesis
MRNTVQSVYGAMRKASKNHTVQMKNLLFISTYPFPLDMGSKQHAYYFIKALSGIYNVYCIFFIPPHVEKPQNPEADLASLDIKAYCLCHFSKPKRVNPYRRFIGSVAAFPSPFMKLATHRQGLDTIKSFIDKYDISIVHFEHFWYTQYAFNLGTSMQNVIVYHDLHHNVFMQLAKLNKRYPRKILSLITCLKFYLYERMLDRKAALKIFLNPVEMLSLPKNATHLPHIVNSEIDYRPVRKTDFFNLLFIGSYNHPPNRRSVEFIIRFILPPLATINKNFKLHIVGPETEQFQDLVDDSPCRQFVELHGFKKEINKAFEEMDIALFPILDGGGIKTKIIDALASGIPVVTTDKGVIGLTNLPDNCIGLGNTAEELVHQTRKLMDSPLLRQERSEAGKDFIDKEHSFASLAIRLTKCYAGI